MADFHTPLQSSEWQHIRATCQEIPVNTHPNGSSSDVSYIELTQLVGGRGCLGGRSPPKHPQSSPKLRNSY